MEAVRKGPISINRAALLHGIPPTTLKDCLSGRVVHGTKPGPVWYLNDEEEHALADHLVEAAKVGYGKTRKRVKSIVEKVATGEETSSTLEKAYLRWVMATVYGVTMIKG